MAVGGAIAACGTARDLRRAHPDLPERDLGEAILLPGLVDAHCHLEWSLMEGLVRPGPFSRWLAAFLPLRARMRPADHDVAAHCGALRALRSGTTTLADSGPAGAGVAALSTLGLRGVVHLEAFGRQTGPAAAREARRTAERVLEAEEDAGPLVRVGVSPHAPYTVGPGLWRALAEEAGLAARPWATHLAESEEETRLIDEGDGPLADLFRANGWEPARWPGPGSGSVARLAAAGALRRGMVAAHCVQLGRADVSRIAAAGVAVAHCPESNARLRCGRSPVEALRGAGVAVGLGSDSPASAGCYDVRAEARSCAREAAAAGAPPPSPAELVRLATLGGAEALGLDGLVGSLEPGKRCDLVAVLPADGAGGSGESAADPCAAALDPASRVVTVVVDGRELLRDGEPVDADAREIEAAGAAARARLANLPR